MKILRGIFAGIAFAIISQLCGWLIYGGLFIKYTEECSHLFRPMDSPFWQIGMPLTDLLFGLLIALGYALLYKGICGTGVKKGLMFGFILWLIIRVPGELFWYTMSPIPFMLVVAGWIHGLIVLPLGGAVIALIYGKSLEAKEELTPTT